jgi:hypothetical protein
MSDLLGSFDEASAAHVSEARSSGGKTHLNGLGQPALLGAKVPSVYGPTADDRSFG